MKVSAAAASVAPGMPLSRDRSVNMEIAKPCTTDSRGAFATMAAVCLLLLFVVFAPAQALAQNATTTRTLDLKAAMQGIAYQASYTGDANSNNTATVQYRQTGTATWRNAYIVINGNLINPFNDRRATIDGVSNPYYHQFRGSIVGLQPGTSYDVLVTMADPDGVSGSALSGTIITAALAPPSSTKVSVNAVLTQSGSSSNYATMDCAGAS